MQTRKKACDGSASARVMQRAELLQCVVEYLGDDEDLCSAATLCRTASDDSIWSPLLNRLCYEFPQPEYDLPIIPGFTTDSHAAFSAHCHSWHHCESRKDLRWRLPAAFVDPRHADPEGFAQLPAARRWAALRMHMTKVLRRLRVPLTDAAVRANMKFLADWVRDALCDHELFHEDEVQQALARVTTRSTARACTGFCISELESNGLCPGSYARDAIVDGWANWGPSGTSSANALLWCITGVDFGP
ncbi:hypothetical protein JKP88DRAFT_282703 [Tribonema minus]|uniref:Uncharacterized protein n=1 Tax=Tribonema minus TaxID=303371 RepID=A0A835YLJ0_9STRA|nr:hypothetical protein JKP88DRAFT_282703 [Tribonema minus]